MSQVIQGELGEKSSLELCFASQHHDEWEFKEIYNLSIQSIDNPTNQYFVAVKFRHFFQPDAILRLNSTVYNICWPTVGLKDGRCRQLSMHTWKNAKVWADNSEKSLVCASSEETLALSLNVNMVLSILIFNALAENIEGYIFKLNANCCVRKFKN